MDIYEYVCYVHDSIENGKQDFYQGERLFALGITNVQTLISKTIKKAAS